MLSQRHIWGKTAALALAALLIACGGPGQQQHGAPAAQQTPVQLGFKPLATAEQLGPNWPVLRSQHSLAAVALAPDSSAALLALSSPTQWKVKIQGVEADTRLDNINVVWLDLPGAAKTSPYSFPGQFINADFAAHKVMLRQPVVADSQSPAAVPAQTSQVVAYDLSAPNSPPAPVTDPAPAADGTLTAPDSTAGSAAHWTFDLPVSSSSGTGRADMAGKLGAVHLYADATTTTPVTVNTGSLPFSELAGDSTKQHAFLALDGAGVAMVDMTPGVKQPVRWLIRDSSGAQFFLQPASGQLVVATDDGLSTIGLEDLATLAPRLGAALALNAKQIKQLKPATKALGWDWPSVQFNPLGGTAGRLDLLDSADADSTTAELQWSATAQHALRLLITRRPRPEDEALRLADDAAQRTAIGALLTKLGWPNALPAKPTAVAADAASEPVQAPPADADAGLPTSRPHEVPQGPRELQVTWTLEPGALAPRDPGKLTLWLTADAAVWDLHAATAEVPKGALTLEAAALKAVDAAQKAAGFTTNPMALPGGGEAGLYAAQQPRFGWALTGPAPFKALSPEEFKGSVAVYEFDVLQTSLRPMLYTVRVPLTGDGTADGPRPAGFDTLRRARQGEFGSLAADALRRNTASLAAAAPADQPPASPPPAP